MNNKNDFIIEDGVLVKYLGKASKVVIPSGVTSIGRDAFRKDIFDKSESVSITSVVIP